MWRLSFWWIPSLPIFLVRTRTRLCTFIASMRWSIIIRRSRGVFRLWVSLVNLIEFKLLPSLSNNIREISPNILKLYFLIFLGTHYETLLVGLNDLRDPTTVIEKCSVRKIQMASMNMLIKSQHFDHKVSEIKLLYWNYSTLCIIFLYFFLDRNPKRLRYLGSLSSLKLCLLLGFFYSEGFLINGSYVRNSPS